MSQDSHARSDRKTMRTDRDAPVTLVESRRLRMSPLRRGVCDVLQQCCTSFGRSGTGSCSAISR